MNKQIIKYFLENRLSVIDVILILWISQFIIEEKYLISFVGFIFYIALLFLHEFLIKKVEEQ